MTNKNKNARNEQSENHGADQSAKRAVNASLDRKHSDEPQDRSRAAAQEPDKRQPAAAQGPTAAAEGLTAAAEGLTAAAEGLRAAAEGPRAKPAADISQLTGTATYDHLTGTFLFDPSDVAFGRMDGCIAHGVGWRLTDGTFQFAPEPRLRARSRLILKLPHGRLSRTVHDEVQLTLKFRMTEPLDIPAHLGAECLTAVEALDGYLASGQDVADGQASASQPDGHKGHPASQTCGQGDGEDEPADRREPDQADCGYYLKVNNPQGTIILFGPAAGAKGFVEEKSTPGKAQRPKCPKGCAATGDAPCGECPRRGGEALPTDRREPDGHSGGHNQKSCDCSNTRKRDSARRSKHSDSQGFGGVNPTC